jgi:hypothetical protein
MGMGKELMAGCHFHRRALARLVGLGACLLPLAAFAELPPLSPEEQASTAAVIVTGRVKSVKHRTVRREGKADFVDDQATVAFQVEKVLKGTKIRPREVIQVHYWRAERRPQAWAGPGGQSEPLKVGTRARLFLKREGRTLDLLIPNGWVPIGKPPATGGAAP